jgi:phosphatidylethanolamine-binding protein (PEBP) family uncharacterized protein
MEISYGDTILSKEPVLFIPVEQTQNQPKVVISPINKNYSSLFMYDPNAVGGIFVHWLVLNIPQNRSITEGVTEKKYYPPSPPQGSGKHTYIFKLYTHDQQLNILQDSVNNYNEVLKVLTSGGVNEVNTLSFISENANEKKVLALGGGKKNRKQKKTNKMRKIRIKRTKMRRTRQRRTKQRRTKQRRTRQRRTKRY